MKKLLRNSNAQIVTTTIQKFQSEREESKLQDAEQEDKQKYANKRSVVEPCDRRAEFEVAYKKVTGEVETLMQGHVSTDIKRKHYKTC